MKQPEFLMPGSRVRETHAATVLSIVGADRMIPVESRGTAFAMRGPFGWRSLAAAFAAGERDTRALARTTEARIDASITIAETPDEVSTRTYLALIGGAYHEAFHRLYTQQGALTEAQVRAVLAPALSAKIDWSKRGRLLLDLQNVFEDVAIERIGNVEFPGVHTKMCDLADFIVRQESESRAKAGNPATTVVNAVFVALRDVGLGYETTIVRENLSRIARECPKGFAMVAPGGLLHSVLLRSIPDVSTPDAIARAKRALIEGSALSLAIETVIALEGAAQCDEPNGPKGDGPNGPKGDGPQGGKGDGPKGEGPKGEGPKGEGPQGDGPQGDGPQGGKGTPSKGGKGEPSKGEGPKGGEPNGSKSEGTPSKGEGPQDDAGGQGEGTGDEKGAVTATAKDFLDGHAKNGKGSMDSNAALEAAVRSETVIPKDYKSPMPYKPYTTSHDEVVRVHAEPSRAGSFATIVKETRAATAYLRTKLAMVFRAMENSGIEHGVRKGPRLSDRMMVDSVIEMRGGTMPTRAYLDRTPQVDTSIAAALVIDESFSMNDKLRETCAAAYTLMDALDAIGARTMAFGFREKSGKGLIDYDYESAANCHRTLPMCYDLFKGWDETFKVAAPRLREIKASCNTPMADGIEFALRELSHRKEGHRIMFVLTDGKPNSGHERVMEGQFARAAAAGILVIGVGLGRGSQYVETTFPDSVYHASLAALPKLLVKKLETLVRTRATGAKRGRTVRAA